MAGDESSMPAEHGGGLDDEEHLAEPAALDGLRQHREDGSVGLGQPWPLHLALEDQDLVPQGQDLGVAAIAGHRQQPDTGDEQPQNVGERAEHSGHRTEQVQAQDQDIRLLGTLRPTTAAGRLPR